VSSATGEINYLIKSKLSTTPGPFFASELSSLAIPTGLTSSVNGLEVYLDDAVEFLFLLEKV